MIKGELIGLPAVGKSWVIENKKLELQLQAECKIISRGFNCFKLTNMILSLLPYVNLFTIYGRLYKSNQKQIYFPVFTKRIAIMFERLGHLKRKQSRGLCIDEGPIQSVWAVFHELPLSNINMHLATKLIGVVSVTNKVVFISVPKNTHKKRMLERARKHPIQSDSPDSYLLSRNWLAFIIKCLRKNQKIQFIQNL